MGGRNRWRRCYDFPRASACQIMSTAPSRIRRPHWLCGHSSHHFRWPALQIARRAALTMRLLLCVSLQFLLVGSCLADGPNAGTDPQSSGGLAGLSLQELSDVQVTSTSKEPEELRETPAAVYVLTAE